VGRSVFVVVETGQAQDSGAVGRGQVRPVLTSHRSLEFFGVEFVEALDAPQGLPFIGRRVHQMVGRRNVGIRLQPFNCCAALVVEV